MKRAKTLSQLVKLTEANLQRLLVKKSDIEALVAAEEERLQERYNALQAERECYDREDLGQLCDFAAFSLSELQKCEEIEENIAKLRQSLQLLLNELREIYNEKKKYEVLLDAVKNDLKLQENAKEVRMLDELAVTRFMSSGEDG